MMKQYLIYLFFILGYLAITQGIRTYPLYRQVSTRTLFYVVMQLLHLQSKLVNCPDYVS